MRLIQLFNLIHLNNPALVIGMGADVTESGEVHFNANLGNVVIDVEVSDEILQELGVNTIYNRKIDTLLNSIVSVIEEDGSIYLKLDKELSKDRELYVIPSRASVTIPISFTL